MRSSIIKANIALLGFAMLFSACSSATESSAPSGAQQQNANAQQQTAQATPAAANNPAPVAVRIDPPANANVAKPPAAVPVNGDRIPKLVAPKDKINFGKQPQDKTFVRAIAIRNGGKADLNIESVTPS